MNTFNNPIQKKEDDAFDKKRLSMHSDELGFDIPEDYFITSKQNILSRINQESSAKTKVVVLKNKKLILSIAASIAILFTLTVFQLKNDFFDSKKQTSRHVALLEENNDLINSLFVEQADTDDVVDIYLNDKVLEDL